MIYKGVCRTAPAATGLLRISLSRNLNKKQLTRTLTLATKVFACVIVFFNVYKSLEFPNLN